MPYLFALQMQISLTLMLLCAAGGGGSTSPAEENTSSPGGYEDLLALFEEWRGFEEPRMIGGVPDYTAPAMAAQYQELSVYRRRLDRIDPGGWPVPRQVDYRLVRAEMNGLAFDHRIRRPWARNPAFYRLIHAGRSDVPAHEGPNAYPPIEIWTYAHPLDESDAGELAARIQTIPGLLDQARANLIEDARGLWMGGIRAMQTQIADLEALRARVTGLDELISTIDQARQATAEFQSWLEQELPSRNGPSGVGKENYTWYLQQVHLVPFTWEEEVTMMRRELARAHAALRLEEHRNRDLPPLEVVASAEEYDRRFNASVDRYMAFLEAEEVISVRDYMDAALRARIGSFSPASGPRGFFAEVSYRDPLVLMTHFHHWIELAVLDNNPHSSPIRRKPLLYNIFDGRSEGLATGLEEMLMHAGLFDDRPRARELVWIMLARKRAAKTLQKYPKATRYRDFRKMLEQEKNIDAVVVATPDHTHAVATMAAIKAGKHVYCEKPLTHSVYEARRVAEAAREAGVATQMGTQGHALETVRVLCEWIWDGAIGQVREVHAWTTHAVWPQGIGRPADTQPVPRDLDWDLWLGPAPFRPYHPVYAPIQWRGWWDFGTGAVGDMACHIFDPIFWALRLGHPESVEARHSYFVRLSNCFSVI